MPRKTAYDISNLIFHLTENKEEIIDNIKSEINPPSSNIWQKVSKLMNYEISAKNIYTVVKLNRYDVMRKLNLVPTPALESKSEQVNYDPEFLNYYSNSESSDQSEENVLSFNITLMAEEWANIYEPTEKYYNRSDNKNSTRVYTILK